MMPLQLQPLEMGIQRDQPSFSFICHRGVDTKKNIAGLIFWILNLYGLHPFLDVKSIDQGESIPETINGAIHVCTIGIVLFSPRFCDSKYCLEELVLLLELNKAILPIFWNVQPAGLFEVLENNNQRFPERDIQRYRTAIEKAKSTYGVTFQSDEGNWVQLLDDIVNAVRNINSKRKSDSPMQHHFIKSNL